MNQHARWRTRARGLLESYFHAHSFPRSTLSAILLITGFAGFILSFALLHAGVAEMAIRYPVAVLGAYACCLGLIRLWAEFERRRFDPEKLPLPSQEPPAEVLRDPPTSRSRVLKTRSWWRELDSLDFSLDDEGCLVVLLLAAVLAVLILMVAGATELLAEIFLDAFFVTALYRRLRVAAVEHWLGTALRKTWWRALLVAFLLGLLGLVLEHAAPGAPSIGPALRQVFGFEAGQ